MPPQEVTSITKAEKNAVLGATAKTLAWELYAAAAYGRTRAYVDVDRFERVRLTRGLNTMPGRN